MRHYNTQRGNVWNESKFGPAIYTRGYCAIVIRSFVRMDREGCSA